MMVAYMRAQRQQRQRCTKLVFAGLAIIAVYALYSYSYDDLDFAYPKTEFIFEAENIPHYLPPFMKDYIHFHRTARHDPNSKYVIYMCNDGPCGGIGDRLKGMATLFYFAIITKRVFLIYHRKPFDISLVFMPKTIDWRYDYRLIKGKSKIKIKYYNFINSELSDPLRNPYLGYNVLMFSTNMEYVE